MEERGWKTTGTEAVIDKDPSGERLATLIRADKLVILTDVDAAYIDFGKSTQRRLERITISEARKYLREQQFASGSMEPKVLSGVRFVENGENQL